MTTSGAFLDHSTFQDRVQQFVHDCSDELDNMYQYMVVSIHRARFVRNVALRPTTTVGSASVNTTRRNLRATQIRQEQYRVHFFHADEQRCVSCPAVPSLRSVIERFPRLILHH